MKARFGDRRLVLWLFLGAVIGLAPTQVLAQSQGLPTRTNVLVALPPLPGQPVTLSAVVSALDESIGLVPGGAVDFYAGANSLLGSAQVSGSNLVGIASLTVQLPDGIHYISAQYNGDNVFAWSYSVPSIPLTVRP